MRASLLFSLIAIAACASGGSDPVMGGHPDVVLAPGVRTTDKSAPHVTTVEFSVEPVFKALAPVYDSLGLPLTVLDFKKHIIGNQGIKLHAKLGTTALSKYIDCGNSQNVPSADTYEVFLSVVTTVKANDPVGSDISTLIDAGAKPMTYAQNYFSCATTGELEKRIANGVKASFYKK